MKKIDSFIGRYNLSKTLRFSLIPQGKTEENFEIKTLLEEDERRSESYAKVKKLIDEYHKSYIDKNLVSVGLPELDAYEQLYFKQNKDDKDKKEIEKLEDSLRKKIVKILESGDEFNMLFKKEIITTLLPEFLSKEEEKSLVEEFSSFTSYFTGFHDNRKNMYSDKAQSTAIAYRCIHDNLPMFLDNKKNFIKIKELLPQADFDKLKSDFSELIETPVYDVFETGFFNSVLNQSGIDRYNNILGGYTLSNGTKIQGLNEYINLFNQQHAKQDKSKKLPFLKPLYKQILSDKQSISFIVDEILTDDELLKKVNDFYKDLTQFEGDETKSVLNIIERLCLNLENFNLDEIYITAGLPITTISKDALGSWNLIGDAWNNEYADLYPMKKISDYEKYNERRDKQFKSNKSFSLKELQRLCDLAEVENKPYNSISEYFGKATIKAIAEIKEKYNLCEKLLTEEYNQPKKLCANQEATELIKNFLDSIKSLERLVKPLCGTGKEENKDGFFYGEFTSVFASLSNIDKLYDKVRNYMTKKPYSKDKIKLNFKNPQILGGWDKNKETDYRTVLLRKNGLYYLAIMDKTNSKAFVNPPENFGEPCFEKMEYKLLPGPNKMLPKVFFADSNLGTFCPPERILEIRKSETFKKGDNFNLYDCHEFIDFFKKSIDVHEDWRNFNFRFTPTKDYRDISEFYNEVKNQGYRLTFKNIPCSYIENLVEAGELFLFQIYNKDFSEYSKGTPNLHTLYFKMLFDERNLKDVVFQLNGGAEMFYRKASIKDKEKIVHPKTLAIDNKNPDNPKKQSLFDYDITKDRRFTKRQFSLHIPITLNFKATGDRFLNEQVRQKIKQTENNYVIGIDRGERHLIYICVVDESGNIVEQTSLNEIISDNGYKVDYHDLLNKKEKERDQARKSWGTVENIKELKEGYLSQVVNKICELVVKYDAVIAMEDLNSGFKNSRIKVEKQVYQKFEKMLTEKLKYLADKKTDPEQNGGILKAYQLTSKDDFKGLQNGFIFYIPPWLTSKIDPTTGFVDLLKPKYETVEKAQEFFSSFKQISYNEKTDMFEFSFDYSDFPKGSQDFKNSWTVCSNGERILSFRNKEKNSEWDNKTIVLTEEFKKLFDKFSISYSNRLKEQICSQKGKDFFVELLYLLRLSLQMRNSETGNVEVDFLISPVRNSFGEFYDSRVKRKGLPENADANGAFNIARKVVWAIEGIKNAREDELSKVKISISNKEWLQFAQEER